MPKSLALVVGAGACKEVRLPVGTELKRFIATALNIKYEFGRQRVSGDSVIDGAFRILERDINPLLHCAGRIAAAMPQALSIDNFIDSHRDEVSIALCGKLAITRCILEAERSSTLYFDPSNIYNTIDFTHTENTWFNAFFQLLTENCSSADIPKRLSNVAIVCFNYDRCIEHYLFSSLKNYYSLSDADATQALKSLEIYHPYGVVGALPWQDPTTGIAYGGSPNSHKLIELIKGLRTFTEGVDPAQSHIAAIRSALSGAQRIAFLGFAFHRLNMDLLFPPLGEETEYKDITVYATALGISMSDKELIGDELSVRARIPRERIQMRADVKCADLFHEYWRNLSLL